MTVTTVGDERPGVCRAIARESTPGPLSLRRATGQEDLPLRAVGGILRGMFATLPEICGAAHLFDERGMNPLPVRNGTMYRCPGAFRRIPTGAEPGAGKAGFVRLDGDAGRYAGTPHLGLSWAKGILGNGCSCT